MKTINILPIELGLLDKLNDNKELQKDINKVGHYDTNRFVSDAQRYINAINSRRMCCVIDSVSRSGMSRKLAFRSCEVNNDGFAGYQNYFAFFIAMGYSRPKNSDYFTISGCGMDMVFHTNYTIINRLCWLGLISKEDSEFLAQQTPTVL
jgi:hypothetical protein